MTIEEYLLLSDQMLRRGLTAVDCGPEVQARRNKKTNTTNFKKHFGPYPNHCETIWKDILVTYLLLGSPDEVDLKGFFMALHFLRNYPKCDQVRATTFGKLKKTECAG
jgi:hypothetical protein